MSEAEEEIEEEENLSSAVAHVGAEPDHLAAYGRRFRDDQTANISDKFKSLAGLAMIAVIGG